LALASLSALVLGGAAATAQPSRPAKTLTPAQAKAILSKPAQMDVGSARLMKRVKAAYAKLASLESVSRGGPLEAIVHVKRPRLYHLTQQKKDGELVAFAVCDGKKYYEYTERNRQYLERDPGVLDRLALPLNVRFFFTAQQPEAVMVGLTGQPTVRDYAFRYSGRQKAGAKPADVVVVSTLSRASDGTWRSFDSTRYYDAATGLLVRAVSGNSAIEIINRPNPKLKDKDFRWRPPPNAVRGFG